MRTSAFAASRLPAAFIHPAVMPADYRVRPAGQAGVPTGQWGSDSGGNPAPLDSNGNPVPLPPGAVSWTSQNGRAVALDASGNEVTVVPSPIPAPPPPGYGTGQPPQPSSDTALFNTIGNALGTTGATIASVVQSNNSVEIAQLQAQTQQQIAALTAQSQQAAAQGNVALAQQRAQQAQQLQMFNAQYLMSHPASNATLYVVAGVVGLLVIGSIVYFARR